MQKRHDQYRWLDRLLLTMTAAMLTGTAVGFVGAILQVTSNRYLTQSMGHLALLTLRNSLNKCVLTFLIVFILLIACFSLLRIRSDKGKNRFLWFATIVVLILIGRLLIDWYAVPIATIPVWIRRTGEETLKLLQGKSTLTHFLKYLRNRLVAGSMLIGVVGTIGVLSWLMRHINLAGIVERWQQRTTLRLLISCAIVLAVVNIGASVDQSINKPKAYNVILIGIDTWRADHLSSFGYDRPTMPNVERLASRGFRFVNAYSTTSWTLPSFLSILTSLYQSSHGVISSEYKLSPSHVTLAEILRNRGYLTAGFISGTYLKRTFGFDQGFDKYEESVTSAQLIKTYDDITSPRITRLVEDWIKSNHKKRFFVFAHYWDPHFDYIPPAPFDTIFDPGYRGKIDGRNFMSNPEVKPDMDPRDLAHIVSLYDGELRWTDSYLGHLFDTLKDLGILDQTIIVLVGDHGEEFFEHGGKGHRNTLYNEVIHVPVIFWLPQTKGGRTVKGAISTVDIVPTILDLLGIEPPRWIDGRTLASVMELPPGQAESPQDHPIYAELSYYLSCMIKGHWKIIYDSNDNTWQLYDIAKDYDETTNLAASLPDTLKILGSQLLKWLQSQQRRNPARSRAWQDAETKRQLKALGYIQ